MFVATNVLSEQAYFCRDKRRFLMEIIALFSASEQIHCALVVCDYKWMTVALHNALLNTAEKKKEKKNRTQEYACSQRMGWGKKEEKMKKKKKKENNNN